VLVLILVIIHQAHSKPQKGKKERVKDIQNVLEAQKIKNIKKVKSILPIDDDLAEQMKAEVKGETATPAEYDESKDDKVLVDPKILYHIERLKKMFNVRSLEEIVDATLYNSTGLDITPTNNEDDSYHDETLDRVNMDISSIENKLLRKLKTLNTEKSKMEKDQKLLNILGRMLEDNLKKIRKIQETFKKQKANLNKNKMYIRDLEAEIKQLEMDKIHQLEKLEKFADLQKEKALYSIGKESVDSAELDDEDLGDIEKELSGIDSENMYTPETFKTIDTDAHNVFPLKKVKSIKKITSMTELTQEQADRLRRAQEKRNEAKYGDD